jgi:hypothetical protein
MCQLKTLEIVKGVRIQGFKASQVWLQKFLKFNDFFVIQQTSTIQRLCNAYEQKLCFRSLGIIVWATDDYEINSDDRGSSSEAYH